MTETSPAAGNTAGSGPAAAWSQGPVAAGQALARYVGETSYLGWRDRSSPPLDGERVIATYVEGGAIKHLRTRYDRARGGWCEPRLRGRQFCWIHDPPLL